MSSRWGGPNEWENKDENKDENDRVEVHSKERNSVHTSKEDKSPQPLSPPSNSGCLWFFLQKWH